MPIITPSQDGSMNLLSQFLTSKMLNDSNRTMNLPETTQLNYSRSSVEPSHTFNARESIIPRLPDTPQPKHQDIVNEIKPSIPPPPPPPPPLKKNWPPIDSNFSHLSGQDAINAELKYLASDEGKAEKARKKAEAAAKRESKKLEKEAGPQQSTTDFLNMSFPTPKKDIVQMLTPQKEPMSSSIIPYKENTSLLDFVMGGTPQKPKTAQEIKHEKNINRLKEIKKSTKTKHIFEYNDLKTEMTGQPNPNQNIGSSMINRAIKGKMARKELENKKEEKKVDAAAKKIQANYKGTKTRQLLNNNIDFQDKINAKIKKYSNDASEYNTRGKYDTSINEDLRDMLKMNRTGLQNFKKTLGAKSVKLGRPKGAKPRPNPFIGLNQTEI